MAPEPPASARASDADEERPVDRRTSVGVRTRNITDARLRFIRQLGVGEVFPIPVTEAGQGVDPDGALDPAKDPDRGGGETDAETLVLRPDHVPSVESLATTRTHIESFDLRFSGIHTVFPSLYDDIAYGTEGREAQLRALEELLRNMGEAGIPVLGYQWNLTGVGRTDRSVRVRGGAEATAFEREDYGDDPPSGDVPTEAEFWEHYEAFLERILPVAEAAGVTLALHPADPPVVDRLDGVPRLFRDVASLRRAMDAVPSDSHGLKLCLGCVSEMGEDVVDVVREFGERDEIVFVHFRDVVGAVPSFHETFVDEGNFDEYGIVRTLRDVGFTGALLPDHVPRMEGDTEWNHRSRAYTVGYLRGLLNAAYHG
jgi:mannonate dehydratase